MTGMPASMEFERVDAVVGARVSGVTLAEVPARDQLETIERALEK